MIICYYGCGNIAQYGPHKGTPHWCCENHWSKCPKNKEINSRSKKGKTPWNKGIKQSKKAKTKQSNSMKKKWKNKEYKEKQNKTRSSTKYLKHMVKIRKGKNNPMSGRKLKNNQLRILKLSPEKIKIRYPIFYKIEQIREKNEKIQVRCKYCKKWFHPDRRQLYERIRQVERKDGNMKSFLYCCDEHKYLCPNSNRIDPKNIPDFKLYARKVISETTKSIKEYYLDNIELRGEENGFQLDHKFSIIEGFRNNIDPIIIGHILNLEVITKEENILKKGRCSISLENLLSYIFEWDLSNNCLIFKARL